MRTNRFVVELTRDARKDLDALRSLTEQATKEVLKLESDPHLGHRLTGSLRGARSLTFSLPGGAYRATYVVGYQERECLVLLVGPHEGLYKLAERRYQALRKQGRV